MNNPFRPPWMLGRLFLVLEADSLVVLDTGAAADLVCFRWLGHRSRISERRGYQKVSTSPLSAIVRFGNGRLGEVPHAAETPVGIAGNKGKFTAFVLDAFGGNWIFRVFWTFRESWRDHSP